MGGLTEHLEGGVRAVGVVGVGVGARAAVGGAREVAVVGAAGGAGLRPVLAVAVGATL